MTTEEFKEKMQSLIDLDDDFSAIVFFRGERRRGYCA